MHYFAHKRAVVTGAGDGIGRELAIALNRAGCRLWLCDIDAGRLADTVALLPDQRLATHTAVVDMGDREAVYAWAASVAADTDHLDLLVNNAGVAYAARFDVSTDANFEWLMNINFWGVVWSTRAFLPLLERSPRGHLVNISSVFGFFGVATQSAYNAAKFAVRGFTEALQAEYRDSALAVSCVHPGGIGTNIAFRARTEDDSSPGERDQRFRQHTPTTPAEAAAIILAGTAKGRRRILVGRDAWMLTLLLKLFPTSYHRFLPDVEA